MNIRILEEILRSTCDYWLIGKEIEKSGNTFKQDVLFVSIPDKIRRGIPYKDIKLVDLKELHNANLDGSIFLNNDYPPFQRHQTLYDVNDIYPIERKHKEFLILALNNPRDNLLEYKKMYEDLISEEKKK